MFKKLKIKGLLRFYSSKQTRNIVAMSHWKERNQPVFTLMIDVDEDADINDGISPQKISREVVIYEFDSIDKIDNWIKVLNLIKDEMQENSSKE